MWENFKKTFYFVVAGYFGFFARIVLRRWQPRIIVVTGSAGKTTVFQLLRAQLGEQAEFAERANSAIGIPFHILGLSRSSYRFYEWPGLFILAPFYAWRGVGGRAKIYIVEADADRPGEGIFTAKLLRPETVLITNVFKTHAANFESLVKKGKVYEVIDAIGQEFAEFGRYSERILINGDNADLVAAIEVAGLSERAELLEEQDYLLSYEITSAGTRFEIEDKDYLLPALMPREVWLGLTMTAIIVKELHLRLDESYAGLELEAGRNSVLRGIKGSILIDSTYNANLGSVQAMLQLFENYPVPGRSKWVVFGEMLEQGGESGVEHESVAMMMAMMRSVKKFVLANKQAGELVGQVLERNAMAGREIERYGTPGEALAALREQITGNEVILLKGGPFLEGIVEGLLENSEDAKFLVRREKIWEKKRAPLYERGE